MSRSSRIIIQQQFTNHIIMLIDGSGSMGVHKNDVIKVVDAQIKRLQRVSVEMNQETRISIYIFDTTVQCIVFDMDVMRFESIQGHYDIGDWTALIDACLLGIKDHGYLPQQYGDHGFLLYAVSDGQNNVSSNKAPELRNAIRGLAENWTIACLVPDAPAAHAMKNLGFPDGAISVWNTSNGFEEVGSNFSNAMDSYMTMRSTGVRGAKAGLFTLNPTGIKKKDLKIVNPLTYDIFPVRANNKYTQIREFVEKWTKEPYRLGSAYHTPVKPIEIQSYKNPLLQDIKTGRVYECDNMREMLGLPNATVKVNPSDHKDWRIFVPSTSVNRKPLPDTFILVRK